MIRSTNRRSAAPEQNEAQKGTNYYYSLLWRTFNKNQIIFKIVQWDPLYYMSRRSTFG
jgi:hypothetical protein